MTYTPTILSAALLSIAFAASPAVSGPISPALQFHFDEGSGNLLFNSGYFGSGSNGTVVGAGFSSDSAFGTGFSLSFDGDTDYVEIPDSFEYADALTVEMWIKPNAVGGQRALYDDYGNPGV